MVRILSASELALKPLSDSRSAETAPRSEIVLEGRPTGHHIDGLVLEAAVSCGGNYLLFTTDDVPYEEFLTVWLLDASLSPLDGVTIGGMYSTGSFSSLRLMEPNSVGFRFIGDTDWSIELLSTPVLGLPLVGDPKGVRRKMGLRRYFKVHGQPRPEGTDRS